jgi:hypothetical protein
MLSPIERSFLALGKGRRRPIRTNRRPMITPAELREHLC